MNKFINKKIIISFLLFNIIPAILVLLDIYLSNWRSISNFIFYYNHSNSIIFSMNNLWNNSSIYLTVTIVLYNLLYPIVLYNISSLTRKYIILLTIIFSILIAFIWWLLTTL